MEVTKRLTPCMGGTKRHVNRFGERLLYVRYRHDRQAQKRYTTVELIVDEQPLIPQGKRNKDLFPHGADNVHVKVDYQETALRHKVKQAGASWLKNQKLWKMRRRDAMKLGLKDRIKEITDGQ